jgi:hypothetical protein
MTINKNIILIILSAMFILPVNAVDDGSNVFYINQDVGIKDRTPSATLHVNGSSLFEDGIVRFSNNSPVTFNGLALVNNGIRIPTGSNLGYVLRSDAAGNATWVNPATLATTGDNLGNHTATTNLNIAGNDINGAAQVEAMVFNGGIFIGDGSRLTGVSGSDNLGNHTATTDLDLSNNQIINQVELQ